MTTPALRSSTPAGAPVSKAARFRALLLAPELTFLMEAHDGLSAKIVEEAGFPGIWASGLTISAALGVRDSNEASWTQVLEVLEFMADATSIPILLDGDTGYGNFNNVRRLVRKLCQRGVAAVCLEDKLFPKTNSFIGEHQPLADVDEFCGKIKAGKDSASDPRLLDRRARGGAHRRAGARRGPPPGRGVPRGGRRRHPDPQQAPDRRRDPRLRRRVGPPCAPRHRAHHVLRDAGRGVPEGRHLGRHLGEPQPARLDQRHAGGQSPDPRGGEPRRRRGGDRERPRGLRAGRQLGARGGRAALPRAPAGRAPRRSSSPPRAAPRWGRSPPSGRSA